MSRSRKEEMQALYEELRQKVRSMPPGSNVGAFLDEEVTRLAQRMRENLSEEHAEAASCEADFSPSGMSPLPGRQDSQSGAEKKEGSDDSR